MTGHKRYASETPQQIEILQDVPKERHENQGDKHRPPTHSRRGKTMKLLERIGAWLNRWLDLWLEKHH